MNLHSLRSRIVIPTIVLFALALAAAAILNHRLVRRSLEDAAWDHMSQVADFTIKSVESWIAERRNEISYWSREDVFESILASAGPASAEDGNRLIMKIKQDTPAYELILLADVHGNALCHSDADGQEVNIADRDYFQQALEGRLVVSDVIKSRISGNPVLVIAAPVMVDDAPAGILLGALDLGFFTRKFVDPVRLGDSGYIFLADRTGTIFSHPDEALAMAANLEGFEFSREIFRRRNGRMRYAYQDEDVAAVFRTGDRFGLIVVARALTDEVMAAVRQMRNINLLISFSALVLVGLLLVMLVGSITRPLAGIVKVAEAIAMGRLAEAKSMLEKLQPAVRSGRDETGMLCEAVRRMIDGLLALVGQVHHSSVQMVSTATEMTATTRRQETVVADFETSTAQVVGAVKEISAAAQELSQTMQQVRDVAEGTEQLADTGRAGLSKMDESMRQLAAATEEIAGRLGAIKDKTTNIGGVVTTITKVADQTNLLSLNASIEAEKAGEYGLGFAVVAREIGRLADQTAVAALDIEEMVREMQAAVADGVREMQQFTGNVGRETQAVETIAAQLGAIINQIKKLAPQFDTVNDGMQTQSQGTRQISQALAQLSEGAGRISESLRQFNAATDNLRQASGNLQKEVTRFSV